MAGYEDIVGTRIIIMGEMNYNQLIALYKSSTTFVHLSYMDHCPNVVVDAQAAGCDIICSSTGGTSEIVNNGKIINGTGMELIHIVMD